VLSGHADHSSKRGRWATRPADVACMELGLSRLRAHATAILVASTAVLVGAEAAAPLAGHRALISTAGACALAAVCAVVTWRRGEQFSELTLVGLIVTVVALVTFTASTGATGPTGAVVLLLLPTLIAACFLPLSLAAATLALCSAAYAWIAARAMTLELAALWWASATTVMASASATVAVLRHELTATLVELSGLARHDALTGLLNRREFDSRLSHELERCARSRQTCAVLMCDLDRFKAVNDAHGHLVGDSVLKRVAADLLAGVRTIDSVARVGGEEMALLLVDCNAANAYHVAERLRRAVAQPRADEPSITISIGVADNTAAGSAAELLAAADGALYEAKRAGRDRVRRVSRPARASNAQLRPA